MSLGPKEEVGSTEGHTVVLELTAMAEGKPRSLIPKSLGRKPGRQPTMLI